MKRINLAYSRPSFGSLAEFEADYVRVKGGMRSTAKARSKFSGFRLVRGKK